MMRSEINGTRPPLMTAQTRREKERAIEDRDLREEGEKKELEDLLQADP